MSLLNGFEPSTTLRDNEGIIIERNSLHGALIHSENCKYEIYNIGYINKMGVKSITMTQEERILVDLPDIEKRILVKFEDERLIVGDDKCRHLEGP